LRNAKQYFVVLDGGGLAILSKTPGPSGGLFPPPQNHLWIGLAPTQDEFIAQINNQIQIVGFHLDTILGFFQWSPYDPNSEETANGNPDDSDYAVDRHRDATTAAKAIQHPSITYALFLALLYRTLVSERQFSQATKVLNILKMLNANTINADQAQNLLTAIRPAIKT
jgi:hypothetical protein